MRKITLTAKAAKAMQALMKKMGRAAWDAVVKKWKTRLERN